MKASTWFVFANRTDAAFYADGSDHEFHFLSRFSNPKGNRLESELDSDRSGSSFSGSNGGVFRHALDRHHHRHQVVAQRFAGRIARTLEGEGLKNNFSKLVLVAEPRFMGLLRKALPGTVKKKVICEVKREYKKNSNAELRDQVLRAIA